MKAKRQVAYVLLYSKVRGPQVYTERQAAQEASARQGHAEIAEVTLYTGVPTAEDYAVWKAEDQRKADVIERLEKELARAKERPSCAFLSDDA